MKIRRRSIMASESDGNYDKSFKAKGTTYYIEMLSGAGNYVAKWWDTSDNGVGFNNKGFVSLINDFNMNRGKFSPENIESLLGVMSDYDRKPGKPIQDRIKREVAKLLDFDAINSACGKKSIKSAVSNEQYVANSNGEDNIAKGRTLDECIKNLLRKVDAEDIIDWAIYIDKYVDGEWVESFKETDVYDMVSDISAACGKKSVKSTKSINAATDITNLKILTSGIAYVEVYEDSCELGEGEFSDSWEFSIGTQFDNSQEMIDDISDSVGIFTKNLSDYVFLDGSLQTDATVNEFNEIPTDEEVEAWTRGEIKLYVAHLWIGLEVGGGSHQMTDDEAEAFGFSL